VQTATKPPSTTELWRQWWSAGEQEIKQLWQPWFDYLETWGSSTRPSRHREHEERRCEDACTCCVPDAEIVVHARAGERRIVAFELHNSGRRAKEVRVGVGPWTPCSGPHLEVATEFDVPETITLEPCTSRPARMSLVIAGTEAKQDERSPAHGDVDACASAYTDVRFDGCARPIRVAVVVHPSRCDAYEITCDCGCC
jgi:hypothetical protein